MAEKEECVLHEIHAVANGDGSYTADIVANFGREGLQRFSTPKVYISVEEVVFDQNGQSPPVFKMKFTNDSGFMGGFQFP